MFVKFGCNIPGGREGFEKLHHALTSNNYLEEKGAVRHSPEAAWFIIRMTKPTDEYTKVPRWHRDGRMYTANTEREVNSKYATTLLGNPTKIMGDSLFVKTVLDEENATTMPNFEGDGKAYWAAEDEKRARITERLMEQPLIKVPGGSVIKFSWGQVDSPVHSEPDMSGDRVFVSILYGSESEMKDVCRIRKKEYIQ